MTSKSSHNFGYFLAIADMVTYGLLPVVSHYLVATLDPFVFSGVATLVGGIPLFFLLKKTNSQKLLYSGPTIKPLLIIAALTTISSLLFFGGTKLTSGINTGLLVQIEPFYAALLSFVVLGEIIGLGQLVATVIMVIGAAIVVFKGLNNINLGDIFILASPLFAQISHIFAKKVMTKTNNATLVATARLLYGGVFLTTLGLVLSPGSVYQLFSINNLLIIIVFGLVFRCLDLLLWYEAMKRISVSRAAAVIPLSVAISFFGSIFLLKETASPQQFLGLILIFGGLILLSIVHLRQK